MNDDELADRLRALEADAWKPAAPPALRLPVAHTAPRRRRRAWAVRPALAALALIAAVALGAAGEAVLSGGDDGSQRIALAALGPQGAGRATADVSGGAVRLHVRDARPTPPGHVDELWFMTDEHTLVSVGTFRVGRDGRADVAFDTAADVHRYRYVDVSLEPDDGNPEHSTVSILRSAALS